MKYFLCYILIFSFLVVTNCTSTKHITNFNETSTPVGKPKYYQTTSNMAVHFFFGIVPIHEVLGNSSFGKTLEDFTADAVKNENNKVHIIHRETVRYWYVLFPVTAIFTPVTTEITGFVQE